MENKEKLCLALGILSGRIETGDNLSGADWEDLGFDPYKFSSFGTPDNIDIKRQAEMIIFEAITSR